MFIAERVLEGKTWLREVGHWSPAFKRCVFSLVPPLLSTSSHCERSSLSLPCPSTMMFLPTACLPQNENCGTIAKIKIFSLKLCISSILYWLLKVGQYDIYFHCCPVLLDSINMKVDTTELDATQLDSEN